MAKKITDLISNLKGRASGGELISGVNVRRNTLDPEVWQVAHLPGGVRQDGWIPFQRVALTGTGSDAVFMRNGNEIGVIVAGGDAGADALSLPVTGIGMPGGEVLGLEVVTAGTIKMLMRHSRTQYITYAPSAGAAGGFAFTLHGEMPDLPVPHLEATNEVTLSEPFSSMTLSGLGENHGSLNNADARTAGTHLVNAYRSLQRHAASLGYFIQPTVARCRLVDAAGDTIAVGAPVVLGATGGFQCCGEITLSSADHLATLGKGALTARAYRARLVMPKGMTAPWRDIVAAAIVETTVPAEPVDAEQLSHSAISVNGNDTTVRLRLPGVPSTADTVTSRNRSLIRELAASECFAEQLRVERPFDITGAVERNVALTPAEGKPLPPMHPLRDAVSFGAMLASPDYGTCIYADPLTEAFAGHSPAGLITSTRKESGASWQATATVRIVRADGSEFTAARGASGDGYTVTGVSPLLTYPDPDARAITLTIANTTASGTRTIVASTYPLTRVAGTAMAAYVDSAATAMMPSGTATAITLPATTVTQRRDYGELRLCAPMRSMHPIATLRCGSAPIAAIAYAPRSRATWDFARRKLLVFGMEGTRLITLDKTGAMRSTAMLDLRPIRSARAVCHAAADSGPAIMAVAGGDLVEITQSSVKTLVPHCRGEFPGWCTRHREAWLAGGGFPTRRVCIRNGVAEEVEAATPGGDTLIPIMWGNRLLLSDGHSLLDSAADPPADAVTPFALRLRHTLSPAESRPLRIAINLFAAHFSGTLTISGDNGSRVAEKLVEYEIEGELNAPLHVKVPMPLRRWVETSAEGAARGDCRWHIPLIFRRR